MPAQAGVFKRLIVAFLCENSCDSFPDSTGSMARAPASREPASVRRRAGNPHDQMALWKPISESSPPSYGTWWALAGRSAILVASVVHVSDGNAP